MAIFNFVIFLIHIVVSIGIVSSSDEIVKARSLAGSVDLHELPEAASLGLITPAALPKVTPLRSVVLPNVKKTNIPGTLHPEHAAALGLIVPPQERITEQINIAQSEKGEYKNVPFQGNGAISILSGTSTGQSLGGQQLSPLVNVDAQNAFTAASSGGREVALDLAIERCGENIKIVFIGDTIMAKMRSQTRAQVAIRDIPSAILGVEGFHIEQMNDFFNNLDIKSLAQASLVVINIGSDNIGSQDTQSSVFEKITEFVETVRSKFQAAAKIVIVGILPRDQILLNKEAYTANSRLAVKYKKYEMVKFLDLTQKFIKSDAAFDFLKSDLYTSNGVNINAAGYKVVIDSLGPYIKDIVATDRLGKPGLESAIGTTVCDLSILDTYADMRKKVSFRLF